MSNELKAGEVREKFRKLLKKNFGGLAIINIMDAFDECIAEHSQLEAAAPDLLAVVQEFSKWDDGWCPSATCCAHTRLPIHKKAIAAIAKATHEPREVK